MLWAQATGMQHDLFICQTMWGMAFLFSIFSIIRGLISSYYRDIQKIYDNWAYFLLFYFIQIIFVIAFYAEWKQIPASLYYVFPSNYTIAAFIVDDDDEYDDGDDYWLDDEIVIIDGWTQYPPNSARGIYSFTEQINNTFGVLLSFLILLCVIIICLKVQGDHVIKAIATKKSISHAMLDISQTIQDTEL